MPPILDGTAAHFGAYTPTLLERIAMQARPKLWAMFAAALICGAAVLVEVAK